MTTLLICVALYVLFMGVFLFGWMRWQNELAQQDQAYNEQQWRNKLHAKHGRKYGH